MENLAESFQESVASGEATGAYAELIERLGKDVESYNELMKDKNEIERGIWFTHVHLQFRFDSYGRGIQTEPQ